MGVTPKSALTMFRVFSSPMGYFGLIWTSRGLKGVTFPLPTRREAELEIRRRHADAVSKGREPKWLKELAKQFQRHLRADIGVRPAFAIPPLDLDGLPPFHQVIYRAAIKIPAGRTLTYAELAKRAGSVGAARAVGQAMAKNPLPIIVPCHRVLAAGGKLGGFSAPGGLASKTKILECEGWTAEPRTIHRQFDPAKAIRTLGKNDPKLGRLMRKVGPFVLKISEHRSPYQWLLRSIIFQQLNGKAASTIHARVRTLYGGRDPKPAELLATEDAKLAGAGLSRQKLAALKDLARHAEAGRVPSARKMSRMSDEDIIELLTAIRGVGRWTVEMLLIFGLGRADVLAVDDFAIRKSAMLLHGLVAMPDRRTLGEIGDRWRPYRTVASWYLWRALD